MELANTNAMVKYVKTDNILGDMQSIIDASQNAAYQAVNLALIRRNWLLGYRIAEEELKGEERAEYGAGIIKKLSKELTAIYGHGFTKSNLYSFYAFYKTYPQIFQTPSGKFESGLSWSHYAALLQVKDETARNWYANEAVTQCWNVKTLQRNISSQYYYRLLKSQVKQPSNTIAWIRWSWMPRWNSKTFPDCTVPANSTAVPDTRRPPPKVWWPESMRPCAFRARNRWCWNAPVLTLAR